MNEPTDSTKTFWEEIAKAKESGGDSFLLLIQGLKRQKIDRLQKEYEQGNKLALMFAIRICATYQLTVPDWVAKEFIRAVNKVATAEVRSWDEALGSPIQKGTNLKDLQNKREKSMDVYLAVQHRHLSQREPIGEQLFEEVGKVFGFGKTWCSAIYYSEKERLESSTAVEDEILIRYTLESGGFGPSKPISD